MPSCSTSIKLNSVVVKFTERDTLIKVGRPVVAPKGGGIRGNVERFTKESARRLLFWARIVKGEVFLTLTYPGDFPTDGRRVKRDLDTFRKRAARRGVDVELWFLEFQKRGAPHYHAVLSGRIDKAEVSRMWYEIVGSQDENHLKAGTRIEKIHTGVDRYVTKYAVKHYQKEVPEEYTGVGRFWGVSNRVRKLRGQVKFYIQEQVMQEGLRIVRKYKERWLKNVYQFKTRKHELNGGYVWGFGRNGWHRICDYLAVERPSIYGTVFGLQQSLRVSF